MTVTVRLARAADAADIARLMSQLGYDVEVSAIASRVQKILTRDDQRLLIAEMHGRGVGWVHAVRSEYLETGAFVLIGGLVVDRAHRRHGIGRALMREAEEFAREQGCSVVRLSSSASRTDAHRFYQQLGYAHIKTQFAFARSLDPGAPETLARFVPRVE